MNDNHDLNIELQPTRLLIKVHPFPLIKTLRIWSYWCDFDVCGRQFSVRPIHECLVLLKVCCQERVMMDDRQRDLNVSMAKR